MGYAAQSDIEAIFGATNVGRWADPDGTASGPTITARIARALLVADERIDARLRGGPYVIPFAGTAPVLIVEAAAALAGVWLYESRGVQDFDPDTGQPRHLLSWHKRNAEQALTDIRVRKLVLDLTEYGEAVPKFQSLTDATV